jgi:hypothetical protein
MLSVRCGAGEAEEARGEEEEEEEEGVGEEEDRSQIRTEWSPEPERMLRASGEKASEQMSCVCPESVCVTRRAAMFHT